MSSSCEITVKKYNGKIQRVFHFDRLFQKTSQYLHFQSDSQLVISEHNVEKIFPYRTDFFLYPEKWFNIFMFYNADKSFHDAFCNFTMPPSISDTDINFVDLDIDLIVKPDASITIEDEDEYKERSTLWGYPTEFQSKANSVIQEITSMVKNRLHPFTQGWI